MTKKKQRPVAGASELSDSALEKVKGAGKTPLPSKIGNDGLSGLDLGSGRIKDKPQD